jgi:RHS repeat-associated protein
VSDAVTDNTLANDDIEDQGYFISQLKTVVLTPGNPPLSTLVPIITDVGNNYKYDAIGNLTGDKSEEISDIEWTVYGKIAKITRIPGSLKDDLEFKYDAAGNRITKIVKPRNADGIKPQNEWTVTHYTRDAQGNVMATYNKTYESLGGNVYRENTNLMERTIYGSSRLGLDNQGVAFNSSAFSASIGIGGAFTNITPILGPATNFPYTCMYDFSSFLTTFSSGPCIVPIYFQRNLGKKSYEISNHLGNVLTVVSDRKIAVETTTGSNTISHYKPEIISATDFYPFGMPMGGRNFKSSGNFPYGFNGKLKVDEISGDGNHIDFGARGYDTRLGRWWSIDPLFAKYPYQSPYDFAINNPILFIDKDGEDIIVSTADYDKVVAALGKITQDEVKITVRGAADKHGNYTLKVEPKKDISISEETKVVMRLASKDAGKHTIKINNEKQDKSTGTPKTKNTLIDFDPNDRTVIENKDGSVGAFPEVFLYHELLHSESFIDGTQDGTPLDGAVKDDGEAIYAPIDEQKRKIAQGKPNTPLSKEEMNIRAKENKFRDKLKISQRKEGTTFQVNKKKK